jgi:hypothetical protein
MVSPAARRRGDRIRAALLQLLTAAFGTLLPRANPAACPQLAKADFASSSQHVREGQRIAELDAQIDELERQASHLAYAICADGGKQGYGNAPPEAILGVRVVEAVQSAA